jgi:hypothetical protein
MGRSTILERLSFAHIHAFFHVIAQPRLYTGMSSQGGDPFKIVGVLSVGQENINITIGGAPCSGVTKTIDNGRPITDPEATFTLSCFTPAGVGKNLPIILTTLGGSSRVDPDFLFSVRVRQLLND